MGTKARDREIQIFNSSSQLLYNLLLELIYLYFPPSFHLTVAVSVL